MSEPGAEAGVTTEGFRVEPALGPLTGRGRSRPLRPPRAWGCSSSPRTRTCVRCSRLPPRANLSQASVTCSSRRPR